MNNKTEKSRSVTNGLNRKAYLGKLAQDILYLTSEQVSQVYAQRGLLIPVEVSSSLDFLYQHEKMALSELANALNIPHQLAAQRVAKLLKLGLLFKNPDNQDKRKSLLQLSALGIEQAQILQQCMDDMAVVYAALYDEINCDLPAKLQQAIDSLNQKSLSERFHEKF